MGNSPLWSVLFAFVVAVGVGCSSVDEEPEPDSEPDTDDETVAGEIEEDNPTVGQPVPTDVGVGVDVDPVDEMDVDPVDPVDDVDDEPVIDEPTDDDNPLSATLEAPEPDLEPREVFDSRAFDAFPQRVPDDDAVTLIECPRSHVEWSPHRIDPARQQQFTAPKKPQKIDWPIDEQTELCGLPWVEIISASPAGDAWIVLAREYIAARLNMAAGISFPLSLERDLSRAENILGTCRALTPSETTQRRQALQIAQMLADFNDATCPPPPQ